VYLDESNIKKGKIPLKNRKKREKEKDKYFKEDASDWNKLYYSVLPKK